MTKSQKSEATKTAGQWSDLAPRVMSAIAMVVVGGAAVWAGGLWFAALGIVIVGVGTWEMVRMIRPGHATMAWQEGVLAGAALALALFVPGGMVAIILGVLLMVLIGRTGAYPMVVAGYGGALFLAGYGLVHLRGEIGLIWTLWLIGVVIVTDVAGYFAGRLIGGPKFWPKVSPKKTWSGTIAGWIGAVALSAWMVVQFDLPQLIIAAAVVVSLASQMGDVAESAMKRKMRVKDSSHLIPGHGGVLDRVDGMIGAALMVTVWMLIAG